MQLALVEHYAARDTYDVLLLGKVRQYVTERFERGEIRLATRRSLWYGLSAFALFVGDVTPAEIQRDHIKSYLQVPTVSSATKRVRLTQLRNWFEWMIDEGDIIHNPTRGLKPPPMVRALPRGMQHDAVGRVLAQCSDTRSHLITLLMVQEGLRCMEVVGLQVGDIDSANQLMLVVGKGGHQRVLPVSSETGQALDRYLTEYPATAGPLIRSYIRPAEGISPPYVSRLMSELMGHAGVKRRQRDGVSAHALRHTAATDMLKAGAHLRDIQAALGHASLSTTQRYLPWQVDDLRNAMGGRRYVTP